MKVHYSFLIKKVTLSLILFSIAMHATSSGLYVQKDNEEKINQEKSKKKEKATLPPEDIECISMQKLEKIV